MLLAGLVLVAFCGFVAVAYRRRWAWTGLASAAGERKTLWDWLSLLVVPAALALGVFALDSAQADRAREREVAQAERDRAIAEDRNRADVLRAYMTQMTDLMLEHGLARPRKVSRERDTPVEVLATTLTASALAQLDGRRKGEVLRFLSSSGLIEASGGRLPRVRLDGSDLREVVARNQSLISVDLTGANLRGADLRNTDLGTHVAGYGPQFASAALDKADFRGASINYANFDDADLSGADLSRTLIGETTFRSSCLNDTKFVDASIRGARFGYSQGAGADFSGAELEGVRFPLNAALTDLEFAGARRVSTPFPRRWGPRGRPMTAAFKKQLCPDLGGPTRGFAAPPAPPGRFGDERRGFAVPPAPRGG
jgi:uncharacterized protein YjbI with pentapeptide repeats